MARRARKCRRRCRRRNPEFSKLLKRFPRKGRGLFKRFWGIKSPPAIKELPDVPGIPRNLVGLGKSPAITIADGPKGRHTKIIRQTRTGMLAADPKGKRLYILSGRSPSKKRKLRFLGWVPQTEYIPTSGIEKAGSFKSRKWWVHKHDDAGGKWPKAYQDSAGNVIYARGTYKIGKWIEK